MSTPEPSRTVYDVQADLDLDAMLDDAVEDPKCEWKTTRHPEPCGLPARWLVVLSCGHTIYLDAEHYETSNRYFAEHSRVDCALTSSPSHSPMLRTIIASTHRIAS